jgi:hypothetical protein
MGRRQVPVTVLDEMEMLDQEIAPARPIAQKGADLGKRLGVDLAAFGGFRRTTPACATSFGNCIGI